MNDAYDLERFIEAQRETYDIAYAEVTEGKKRSHWMWFVFPQISGLGSSPMARRYAVSCIDEARAYLAHPILGPRLASIVDALQRLPETDGEKVFGAIDALKLRSSLTLFARADTSEFGPFADALRRWFDGVEDPATIGRL